MYTDTIHFYWFYAEPFNLIAMFLLCLQQHYAHIKFHKSLKAINDPTNETTMCPMMENLTMLSHSCTYQARE
jgi:hypothetical protein